MDPHAQSFGQTIGRYVLFDEIAAGGMATVHLGRLQGPVGFSKTVAVKRLHPTFAKDPEFVSMFLDEARLAGRVRHPAVVSTLDVVSEGGELFLVMEYVHGESLASLLRRLMASGEAVPPSIAVGIIATSLRGLQAAHDATSESGQPLGIVHRDVSPQNILVGTDGTPRVADFGVAKAVGRLQTTREGQIKGKSAYMAPEQLRGRAIDHRVDVYAAGVVLWEALVGQRLFTGDSPMEIMAQVLEKPVPAPSRQRPGMHAELDAVVLRAVAKKPERRFDSARDFAIALESALPPASAGQIGDWVQSVVGDTLGARATRITEIESSNQPARPATPAEPPTDPTQASAISFATSPASLPKRKGRSWLWWAAGIILGGSLGMWLLRGSIGPSPTESATPAEGQPVTATAANASVSATSPTPAAAPAPSATPSALRTTPRVPKQPPKPSCKPPYTLNAKGDRVWKRECL